MTEAGGQVRIHYRRIPDREQIFRQRVVAVEPEGVVVTLAEAAPISLPVRANGEIILDPGAPAVWLTFPGAWHDIGRFHRADGTLTGFYANILTPPEMEPGVWRTTDLFLDVWQPVEGPPSILDEDEFEEARARGLLDTPTADRARAEAERLLEAARGGSWPPESVRRWSLDACRARLRAMESGG